MTDEEVIEAIKGNNEDVYVFLIESYKGLAYAIVNKLHAREGVPIHDVLDTLHDSIIKLKEMIKVSSEKELKQIHATSIYTIMGKLITYTSIDKWRKKKNAKINLYEPTSNELRNSIISHLRSDQELDIAIQRLEECIEKLDSRDRHIITLRFYSKMQRSEVASRVNLKLDSFKKHFTAAIKKLKICMGIN